MDVVGRDELTAESSAESNIHLWIRRQCAILEQIQVQLSRSVCGCRYAKRLGCRCITHAAKIDRGNLRLTFTEAI